MRWIPVLLTLIVPCVAAPAAGAAWSPPPGNDAERLGRWLPLARAAWPGSPCAGREVIHLGAGAALRAEAPALAPAGEPLHGMAEPATCEAWVAGGLSALRFCAVLVHELGHLAGHAHTHEPGDAMNGDGDISSPACERATRPPASVLLAQELRSQLPAPRRAWRISCGPRRAGERRCTARRGDRVRRFWVSQTRSAVTVVPA